MHGRYNVSVKDIQALAKPILRHRVMTNFYAESERINSDAIVDRLLETVPLPKSRLPLPRESSRLSGRSSRRATSRFRPAFSR